MTDNTTTPDPILSDDEIIAGPGSIYSLFVTDPAVDTERAITELVRPLLAPDRPYAWRTATTRVLEAALDADSLADNEAALELLAAELDERARQDAADRGAMNGLAPSRHADDGTVEWYGGRVRQ